MPSTSLTFSWPILSFWLSLFIPKGAQGWHSHISKPLKGSALLASVPLDCSARATLIFACVGSLKAPTSVFFSACRKHLWDAIDKFGPE